MSKGKNWVDYKEIKEKISIEQVLKRYGVELKKSGKNLVGCCPIHKGTNPRQFSVNPEKNIFNCFGDCKTGGNVMDFVALMEFGNKEAKSIREAALLLKKWFLLGSPEPRDNKPARKEKEEPQKEEKKINPPLKFSGLKMLVPDHPWFTERSIEPKTIEAFGLGFNENPRGLTGGRIAIPIHDHEGQLVAYCGRAVTDEQIEADGKYKLPANFYKSEVVYNLFRQAENMKQLYVVESYISVWRLSQVDLWNSVTLMGSSMSERQEELILKQLKPHGLAILVFDADEDGEKCTRECLERLGKHINVRWVDLKPYNVKKPHQLTEKQLEELLFISD
jgi:DNA primase